MDSSARLMEIVERMPIEKLRLVLRFADFLKALMDANLDKRFVDALLRAIQKQLEEAE